MLPFSIYNQAVIIESIFSKSRIKALYEDDMRKEYLSIRDFLPENCSAILDIGCGVAGIDYFLYQHYDDNELQLYLLDKTHIEQNVYYMFEPKGAFYNSLDVAKAVLTDSGIAANSIHLKEATNNNDIKIERKVDLVISLLSWGFHYPVETYLERVHGILTDDGVVILDVRKGTNGIDVLRNTFKQVDVVLESKKHYRVAVEK